MKQINGDRILNFSLELCDFIHALSVRLENARPQ